MNKLKKYIIFILILIIPFPVFASDINFNCTKEVMVGSKVTCLIELKPTEKIKGIFANYDYNSVLTYSETKLNETWQNIANTSKGITVVNIDGIDSNKEIAKLDFYVSNNTTPGKEYQIKLKKIQLSNGNNDISIADKISTIKVLSVNEIVETLKVYDKNLKIKDGVTNYTVTVPNEVTSVDIKSTLKNEKYTFAKGFAPKTVNKLKVGDNLVFLQIKEKDNLLIQYQICIHRQTKIEEFLNKFEENKKEENKVEENKKEENKSDENKTNENKNENPPAPEKENQNKEQIKLEKNAKSKDFPLTNLIIILIVLISLTLLIMIRRKKKKGELDEK